MFTWPDEKKCAITLTYDDGMIYHKDYVAPLLHEYGLKATFYITLSSKDFQKDPIDWKKVSNMGHELGNHSIFHPCRKNKDTESFIDDCYDLKKYSSKRFKDELHLANIVLQIIDGKKERSYGATCCDIKIGENGEEIFIGDIINDIFTGIRGEVTGENLKPKKKEDVLNVPCYGADGRSFKMLKSKIKECKQDNGWSVFIIHGIGRGSHEFYIEKEEHLELVKWLSINNKDIWIAPFYEIAKYIKDYKF